MLLLLPPSESKTVPVGRRGRPLDLGRLSFDTGLGPTRSAVLAALVTASERPDALTVLGVPPTLGPEVARNGRLLMAPTAPAAAVYSGVLYEALDLPSLEPAARRRAYRWVVVCSALFGALRLADRIPAYRLSMKVNLPPLGPLAAVWRGPLAPELHATAGRGLVVDARSSTYAAAWAPRGDLASRWVQVAVPGATHLAKHTRGLVARHLCRAGVDARTPARLAAVVGERF
ncbi:MAG: peroxide stress protein YaaA, partial [Lapillicoccus sp.]